MNDLEFAQSCVKGDTRTWDEFIEKYSRLIYHYIHSILKIKGAQDPNRDNAGDLFQEIFVLLRKDNFKKLSTFKAKNGCSLASWLRQVVINYSIDYLRRIKPLVSLEEELGEDLTLKDIIADGSESARQGLFSEERVVNLKDCIEKLDSEEKYFIELHFNQGLSLEALKGVLKLARGAVDMRKTRLIERLRECFKAKGFKLDF
jgi:RNA polymerase sigma factor (sigma-70 family)